jgi:uncharacterized membrane protein
MDMSHHPATMLHVGFGVVALLAGLGAMITPKGGRIHRRCGKVFFWSIVVVAGSAVELAYLSSSLFLFLDTLFTFYLALSGYRALARKRPEQGQRANWLDWVAATVLLASGVGLIAVGVGMQEISATGLPTVCFGYGVCAVLFAGHDLHEFWRPPVTKYHWWLSHMARMLGAYLASVTAVSVVNLHYLPTAVRWFGPILVGGPGIALWMLYYRRRFRRDTIRVVAQATLRTGASQLEG